MGFDFIEVSESWRNSDSPQFQKLYKNSTYSIVEPPNNIQSAQVHPEAFSRQREIWDQGGLPSLDFSSIKVNSMWGSLLRPFSPQPLTSVIIPAYNEAQNIASTINLVKKRAHSRTEIIVADGNSTDATRKIARRAGARVLRVSGGRATQLNKAARCARSATLLFLHADTQVPEEYDSEMRLVLSNPVIAGAFRLNIDSNMLGIKVVRTVANWRAGFLQRPYGDQGLFMTRNAFEQVGGYPCMPFLDDYEMVRQLARKGRIGLSRSSVITSARRWETLGVVTTTLMNQIVIAAYHLGVPVDSLRNWYRGTLIRATRNQ